MFQPPSFKIVNLYWPYGRQTVKHNWDQFSYIILYQNVVMKSILGIVGLLGTKKYFDQAIVKHHWHFKHVSFNAEKKILVCLKTWHSNASLPSSLVTVFASITKGCHKSERILLWIAIVFCFSLLQFQGKWNCIFTFCKRHLANMFWKTHSCTLISSLVHNK